MDAKLEKQLIEKYPEFFEYLKTYDGPPMCVALFGFEHDDGWYQILDDLMGKIHSYCKNERNGQYINIHQIKEKFSGLRFYIDSGDDKIYDMIHEAERLSYITCEICGSTENIGSTKGWLKTLCQKCAESNERYSKTWELYKKE